MKPIYMLLLVLHTAGLTHAQTIKNETMEKNREVVRKLYEEALNKRDLHLLQDLVSPEYTAIQGVKGAAGFETTVTGILKGFADAHWDVQEYITESDKVMVRWKFQGTHTGQFATYAPTGKAVNNDGLGIYQLKDGKVIATQVYTDRLSFLQQLGILPKEI
jgi:predicted ester cyclase